MLPVGGFSLKSVWQGNCKRSCVSRNPDGCSLPLVGRSAGCSRLSVQDLIGVPIPNAFCHFVPELVVGGFSQVGFLQRPSVLGMCYPLRKQPSVVCESAS